MRYHADDRGQRYCDIFPLVGKGDINVTVVEPGAAALWHRHEFQSDYQFVVKGALKIGVCNLPGPYSNLDTQKKSVMRTQWVTTYQPLARSVRGLTNGNEKIENMIYTAEPRCEWFYLGERNANNGPLFIPAGLWHGCYNYTNEPAILVYHITNKYNESNPDEDRMSVENGGWKYEREVK